MEVGRRQRDVAERGHFEHVHVVRISGHIEPSAVGFGDVAAVRKIRGHNPQLLVHVAAEVHSLMATHASKRLEKLISCLLIVGERRDIVAQVTVEPGIGCGERALKDGNGVFDLCVLNIAGIDSSEFLHIFGRAS